MADGVQITSGAGTTVATDDARVSRSTDTQHYQRVKLVTGPDGVAVGDVAESHPLPVASLSMERLLGEILTELRVLSAILANETNQRGLVLTTLRNDLRDITQE